ncbi:ribonuclease P protein subunit [Candidatus Woesearchaeota archaeon]|nr:ribonuclease P protein subunit [Candidatus Woesearchaeota archaeon]
MNKHQQEYIGKKIEITKSNDKQHQGKIGKIINETKNTFTIQLITKNKENKIITILKQNKEFKINEKTINGNKITKKPEERIKIKT